MEARSDGRLVSPAAPALDRPMAAAVALLRVGFGLVYLTNGLSKLTGWDGIHPFPGFLINSAGARGIIQHDVQSHPLQIYKDFILGTVVPHWSLFGGVITLSEIAVGLCLVVGIFTPLAALLGAGFQLHLNFANLGNDIWMWEYAVEWMPLLALAFLHSGHYWGLESRLTSALPASFRRWPLV